MMQILVSAQTATAKSINKKSQKRTYLSPFRVGLSLFCSLVNGVLGANWHRTAKDLNQTNRIFRQKIKDRMQNVPKKQQDSRPATACPRVVGVEGDCLGAAAGERV